MVVKDETRWPVPKKHLRMAFAKRAAWPVERRGARLHSAIGWKVRLRSRSARTWMVYFDEYTRKRYGAMRTRDFVSWEDVSGVDPLPSGRDTARLLPCHSPGSQRSNAD